MRAEVKRAAFVGIIEARNKRWTWILKEIVGDYIAEVDSGDAGTAATAVAQMTLAMRAAAAWDHHDLHRVRLLGDGRFSFDLVALPERAQRTMEFA